MQLFKWVRSLWNDMEWCPGYTGKKKYIQKVTKNMLVFMQQRREYEKLYMHILICTTEKR